MSFCCQLHIVWEQHFSQFFYSKNFEFSIVDLKLILSVGPSKLNSKFFCLIEVKVIVVTVQQHLGGMHCYRYGAHCQTPPTSLYSDNWQYTKPAQINSETDSETVPASKVKGRCAGIIPTTLILVNRPRSDEKPAQIMMTSFKIQIRKLLIIDHSVHVIKFNKFKMVRMAMHGSVMTKVYVQTLQFCNFFLSKRG